jgi:hypothetical protein
MLQVSTLENKTEPLFQFGEQLNMNNTVALVQMMIEKILVKHVYNALLSPSLRYKLHIPDLIWKMLEPKLKARIDETCYGIQAEQKLAKFQSAPLTTPAQQPSALTDPIPNQNFQLCIRQITLCYIV